MSEQEKEKEPEWESNKTGEIEPIHHEVNKRSWWGWVVAAGAFLVAKLKTVLTILKAAFVFLKFGKFLTTGLSMFVMVITYTFIYGWKYALGIVLLLFVHEMGHLYYARRLGLDTSLPLFIPFIGALISMKEQPQDAKTEAIIGLGGPLFGIGGAFVCLAIAKLFNAPLFYALAYFGFFITVFNLIPAHPLDGGRIVTAISPMIWLIGIPVMIGLSIFFFNPIAILISLLATAKAWQVWKDRDNPYYQTDTDFRVKMGLTYFVLFAIAAYYTYELHETLDRLKFIIS